MEGEGGTGEETGREIGGAGDEIGGEWAGAGRNFSEDFEGKQFLCNFMMCFHPAA